MAQIINPQNGNQKGTVTIVGYSERFFMNAAPPVHIMKDLLEIGKVEKNGKIEIAIEEESRIVFKCNQCSCRFSPIVVKPGDWVVLIYDQAMDCIVPVVTDSEHYGQAKMIYRETQKQMIMQMKTREAQRQKMIREAQRPAEIRALKRAGIYSLVVIALGIVAAIGVDIYNNIARKKRDARGTDFIYMEKNMSVDEQSANTESMYEISRHPWKRVIEGDPYGACLLEVLSFSENGNGNCREIRYAGGNVVSASNFSFPYYIDGEKVYCSGTWEYTFKGGKLYDKQNHPYKSGSDLIY